MALLVSALGAVAWSQTPPPGAKDISQDLATATASAPSAAIGAPASVVRVYVDNLTGADAQAVAGLLTQALFQSKLVVVTDQAANATVILKGRVERKPIAKTSAKTVAGSARRTPKVRNLDALDAAATAMPDLPQIPDLSLGSSTDLSQYVYRLDLQAVNPAGELVWMSGLGKEALQFEAAEAAAGDTVQPLLATLKTVGKVQ
ncbi:MAG: hypothetical protein ACRD1E_05095 [Terriglobales bacterium]